FCFHVGVGGRFHRRCSDLLPSTFNRGLGPPRGIRHAQGDRLPGPVHQWRGDSRSAVAVAVGIRSGTGSRLAVVRCPRRPNVLANADHPGAGRPDPRPDCGYVHSVWISGPATRSDRRPRGGLRMSVELVDPSATPAAEVSPQPGIPAIEIRGVNHYFGEGEARNQVLFDNTIEITPGEIVIMTGPSGSGKTTLLTLIGGLRTLQEGSIRVYGQELKGLGGADLVDARRQVGFI